MGLFSAFGGGAKTASASVSATDLLSSKGSFDTSGAIAGALGGGVEGIGRNLLGMDPKKECPSGSGSSGGSSSGDNDPCGQNDDPLKAAALGLGMALLGPTIAEAGSMLGGALDSGLGAVSGAIGGAIAATSADIGGAIGLDPKGAGQSLMNSAIGAGAAVGIGGGSGTDAGVGALNAMATTATKTSTSLISGKGQRSKGPSGFDAVKATF